MRRAAGDWVRDGIWYAVCLVAETGFIIAASDRDREPVARTLYGVLALIIGIYLVRDAIRQWRRQARQG